MAPSPHSQPDWRRWALGLIAALVLLGMGWFARVSWRILSVPAEIPDSAPHFAARIMLVIGAIDCLLALGMLAGLALRRSTRSIAILLLLVPAPWLIAAVALFIALP